MNRHHHAPARARALKARQTEAMRKGRTSVLSLNSRGPPIRVIAALTPRVPPHTTTAPRSPLRESPCCRTGGPGPSSYRCTCMRPSRQDHALGACPRPPAAPTGRRPPVQPSPLRCKPTCSPVHERAVRLTCPGVLQPRNKRLVPRLLGEPALGANSGLRPPPRLTSCPSTRSFTTPSSSSRPTCTCALQTRGTRTMTLRRGRSPPPPPPLASWASSNATSHDKK